MHHSPTRDFHCGDEIPVTPASGICNVPFSGNLAIDVANLKISHAESTDIEQFPNRLRTLRKRFGLNQTDFAAIGGVALGSQQRYESGATLPDAAYLASLIGNGVDVVHLLSGVHSADRLDDRSNALVQAFQSLPEHLQGPIVTYVEAMNEALVQRQTLHDPSPEYRREGGGR